MISLFNEEKIGKVFQKNGFDISIALDKVRDYSTTDADTLSEMIAGKFMIYAPKVSISECKAYSKEKDENHHGVVVVKYSIPYTGHGEMFSFKPTNYGSSSYRATIDDNHIKFEVYTDYYNTDLNEETLKFLKNHVIDITEMIKYSLEQLEIDCNRYNLGLKKLVYDEIIRRKNELQKSKDDLDALNSF